jgi:hypothetical protein
MIGSPEGSGKSAERLPSAPLTRIEDRVTTDHNGLHGFTEEFKVSFIGADWG